MEIRTRSAINIGILNRVTVNGDNGGGGIFICSKEGGDSFSSARARALSIGNKLHFRTKLFNDAEAPTRKNLYLIIREQLEPADSWIRALPLELTTPRKSPILIEQEEEEPPTGRDVQLLFTGVFTREGPRAWISHRLVKIPSRFDSRLVEIR